MKKTSEGGYADMAVQTYWAREAEKQEIIEFIDYVFSKVHRPHDFATLLPKLYGRDGDGAALRLADGGFAFDGFSLPLPLYVAPPDAV